MNASSFWFVKCSKSFYKNIETSIFILEEYGDLLFYYINDSLNQDLDIKKCRSNAEFLIKALKDLGLHINSE